MPKGKKNIVTPDLPIRLVLGNYWGAYIQKYLDSGRYTNASEFVREVLREHEDRCNNEEKQQ